MLMEKNETAPVIVEGGSRGSTDAREQEKPNGCYTKWHVRQTLTAVGPLMGIIASGMTSGYSAVLLPQIETKNGTSVNYTGTGVGNFSSMNQLVVTDVEVSSWIAAASALSMVPGCWISGWLMEKFGRRMAHLILSPIFVGGWLTVGLAPSVSCLVVGRLFCGLCSGLLGPLSPVFVAETSEPRLRGILLAGISLGIAVGILLSQVFGTWLHWRLAALLCGTFPIICFIFCYVSPESPTWLVKTNKTAKASQAWNYLRGDHCLEEFRSLQLKSRPTENNDDDSKEELQLEDTSCLPENRETSAAPESWTIAIRSRSFLKPLLVLNVFFLTTQFSGVNAVAFYCVAMLQDVSGPENAYIGTLVLDVFRVIFSVVACWMTRRYPRRLLAVGSGLATAASLLALSVFLVLDVGKPWLSICLLFLYICVVSIGLVPLPWLLCGELFPAKMRGLGSGFSSGFAFVCFFVVVKTVPLMFQNLGAASTFAIYGSIALSGTVFLYVYLPETKDKTLQEIERHFVTRRSSRSRREMKSVAI